MTMIGGVDGMDISALRLFLASVELGSVSKAAARLHLSQPSATAKLQRLERRLGAALLERSPTGSVPTPLGLRLLPACEDAVDAVTGLVDQAFTLSAERTSLAIATTRHVAEHFLPAWIADGEWNGAFIDVVELDTLHVAQAVRGGQADVGFTDGPHPPLGLGSRLVAEEQLVAVVGAGHPWHRRIRPLDVDELASSSLIHPRVGSGTRDVVEDALVQHSWVRPRDEIEVAGAAAARLAAFGGSGIAFLPHCWAHDELRSGKLSEVRMGDLEIVQPVRMVWRGSRPPGEVARRFVDGIPSC